jgi:dTDP-4-dehydrorhamnose 3,5-epimerase
MRFHQTDIPGVFQIHLEANVDDRGFFARSWCQKEFQRHALNDQIVQCSVSFSKKKGTLRGMHYQAAPYPETKVVSCTKGAIYDVVIDLRRASTAYRHWVGVQLTAADRNMIYVPEGCAHGFITLEDETEVLYKMSEFYHPDLAEGVRWDDPAFAVSWPVPVEVISDRDRSYPDFA